jgi:hypothetical protein
MMNCLGQSVNEKITVLISQSPVLRAEAGNDVVMDDGSAVIGQTAYITGGRPEYTYVWRYAGIDAYTDLIVTVQQVGRYKLVVTDAKNCTAVDSLMVSESTIIEPGENKTQLNGVIVDPVLRQILLNFDGMAKNNHIRLISANGRVMYDRVIESWNSAQHTINLPSLPPGIYLLSIVNDSYSNSQRILIQ